MNVLVACEYSGRVRDEFRLQRHNAWSCDLRPSLKGLFTGDWDLIIAFPPCTYLCSSGARWWKRYPERQVDAIDFVKKCIENPVGVLPNYLGKYSQIIHPWHYGDPYTKATCLWLEGLPLLEATDRVKPLGGIHWLMNSDRDLTFPGVARAMGEQWKE